MRSGDLFAAAEANFDLASCALRSQVFKNKGLAELAILARAPLRASSRPSWQSCDQSGTPMGEWSAAADAFHDSNNCGVTGFAPLPSCAQPMPAKGESKKRSASRISIVNPLTIDGFFVC